MMKQNEKDKSNFVWNIIGLTLYSFVSLLLLIIVKRINGIDVAGIFTYAFSLSTLFFYIALYYSRVYQIANYNNNKSFNQYFSFRIVFCIISFMLIIIFSIFNRFDFYKCMVIFLLMLFRIIDAISDTFYGYQQSKGFLYRVGISYTIKSILGILLFVLVDYWTNNLLYSIIALVFINLITMVLYDYNFYRKIGDKIRFDFSNFKLIVYESFPIFIFSFLNVYLANSQKYVLNYFVDNDIQTIFGILIMPATVLSLVGNYIIMPFVNKLNNLKKDEKISDFYAMSFKILIVLLFLGLVGLVVCYFIGVPVLNIVYGIDLNIYKKLLMVIIMASIMNALSMVISNLMTILNKNKIQLFIYVFISIIGTFLNVLFIKKMLISGAVYSYLMIYILMVVFYVFAFLFSKKLQEEK